MILDKKSWAALLHLTSYWFRGTRQSPPVPHFPRLEKAFDKIDHTKMFISLARLGIPEAILNNIKALYKNPTFKVVQGIHESQWCQRRTGIRQGCPLSPYLFILTTHAILKGRTAIHTIEKHSKGLIFKNFCTQMILWSLQKMRKLLTPTCILLKKSQNIFT